ncbi:hypothetical protein B0H21DRAFT_780561 [Amylocystis lapponica]|nr:hypothetical protein B0H21DRAFT_780561 [Amylocystis lapponica]
MSALYLSLALLPSFASAFSFTFTNTPQQCQNLSLSITGAGVPPYSILITPFGPSPLPNNVEARRIFAVDFDGSSSSASFQLKYPADSEFVAVVSDSTGFGSGGTSGAVTVQANSDSSCFDATQNVSPAFVYNIQPLNQLVECSPTRIWWNPSLVQGTPSFQGVIPGGQSFAIPQGNLSTVPEQGVGFGWTPSVRTGTTLLLIGGDARGPGSGGSTFYIMSQGNTDSCLTPSSPSSTPGSPAGGSYPTSTSGSNSSTGSGSAASHTNVGAIVGGVIGGLVIAALLVTVLLLLRRRRDTAHTQKERPVDLLQDNEHDRDDDGTLPQYYEPDPFLVPAPTARSHSDDDGPDGGARPSGERRTARLSTTTSASGIGYGVGLRAPTPSQSVSTSRKSPLPPSLRPVNIIQHDDAGPSAPAGEGEGEGEEEPETIELPPAYTHIRRASPPPPPRS